MKIKKTENKKNTTLAITGVTDNRELELLIRTIHKKIKAGAKIEITGDETITSGLLQIREKLALENAETRLKIKNKFKNSNLESPKNLPSLQLNAAVTTDKRLLELENIILSMASRHSILNIRTRMEEKP